MIGFWVSDFCKDTNNLSIAEREYLSKKYSKIRKISASRHYGVKFGISAYYICRKNKIMENTTKTQGRRGKGLKFDQEWKDAVDRLPKHYRDEICAAIEAYQRDLTVIEVSEGVPRAIFMLIMPTIRRRYRARELRRLARERKAAPSRNTKSTPEASPSRLESPKVMRSTSQPVHSACEQHPVPSSNAPTSNVPTQPGRSTLDKLLRHRKRRDAIHRVRK